MTDVQISLFSQKRHLPELFREEYPDRVARLPREYRKAIVAVELATRIIYSAANRLEDEIARVCR